MINNSEWTWADDGAIVWGEEDPRAAFTAATRQAIQRINQKFVWSDDDVMVAI